MDANALSSWLETYAHKQAEKMIDELASSTIQRAREIASLGELPEDVDQRAAEILRACLDPNDSHRAPAFLIDGGAESRAMQSFVSDCIGFE